MSRKFLIHGCIPCIMTNYTLEDIEAKVIQAYRKDELRGLPRWMQDICLNIKSDEIRGKAFESLHLYRMCEYQVNHNTPDGWDTEISAAYDGQSSYCHAARTIDGLIDTIPSRVDGWLHGNFINGYFGYKMIGGSPWSAKPSNRDSGARVTLRHSSDSPKTTISVSSHPDDYQFAIKFAQSLVDDALSGRLQVRIAQNP